MVCILTDHHSYEYGHRFVMKQTMVKVKRKSPDLIEAFLSLKLCITRKTRERNDITYVGHARYKQDESFKAKTKTNPWSVSLQTIIHNECCKCFV